jgi:predicted nucleic acid-binding protein
VQALADTSAWTWSRRTATRAYFGSRLVAGEFLTCDIVKLELLADARNGEELDLRRYDLDVLTDCPIGEVEFRRALDVYRELAHQSGAHQRGVKHADLLIAAAAESAGIAGLHYDQDFDRIAEVTEQVSEWLAPRGSL